MTFEAESGLITAPFKVQNGIVSQVKQTTDPAVAGKAVYSFIAPADGRYTIKARVNANTTGANSVFVNVDGEPLDTMNTWDVMPLTAGTQERTVTLRGNGTETVNAVNPWKINLKAGVHTIVIRGREANMGLDSFTISYDSVLPVGVNALPAAL
jgi:hypothetical protein